MRGYSYPNAPKTTVCRLCKKGFPNPVANGHALVTVVCKKCRHGMMSAKTLRSLTGVVGEEKTGKTGATSTPHVVEDVSPITIVDFDFKCLNDYRDSLLKATSEKVMQ